MRLIILLLLIGLIGKAQFLKETRWMDIYPRKKISYVPKGTWVDSSGQMFIKDFPVLKLSKKWNGIPCMKINSGSKPFLPPNTEFRNENCLRESSPIDLDSVNFTVQTFLVTRNYVSIHEYALFENWVKDSTNLFKHVEKINEGDYQERLNWKEVKKVKDIKISRDSLEYEYWLINWNKMPKDTFRFELPKDTIKKKLSVEELRQKLRDRSEFIIREEVPVKYSVYWGIVKDENVKSLLDEHYLTHPYFKNYPVLGLTKEQQKAYLNWCTEQVNGYRRSKGKIINNDIRFGTTWELMLSSVDEWQRGTIKIKIDKEFIKAFGSDNWDLGEVIEVPYPTKPFRMVRTTLGRCKFL